MRLIALATFCCLLSCAYSFGQKTDTTGKKSSGIKNSNFFRFAIGTISRGHSDSSVVAINTKSETPFLPYQGKGIRHIFLKQYGFERAFSDTAKAPNTDAGSRLLNSLHRNTRNWVIRNNLFVSENSTLNAYKVADNERYLRSLEYIQDARIIVVPIPDNPDSVDLLVITKDLFSITGELNSLSTNSYKGSITDANVLGMGQKVQVTTSLDPQRSPNFGYVVAYTKNNIGGSFINASVQLATINNDLGTGAQDEHAKAITFQRPLYSQYSHMAGALTIGDYESRKEYVNIPDSSFFKYHYNVVDGWIGYNIGIQKIGLNSARDRRFVSVRYFRNHFSEIPYQVGDKYFFKFNDRQAILGQFTFFKQDFYKTNYIYGFGTTEDVPYGYNIALTAGWYKQLNLSRPYVGANFNWYVASQKKDFIQYFVRTGAFYGQGQLEDASILFGSSLFSHLYVYKGIKVRQYLNVSYTKLFNRVGLDPLRIDNVFGIRYFTSDSVLGDQRMSLHTETSVFLKYKLLGFKFAPFVFADFSLITPEHQGFSKSALFYSLGGGLRLRNENLVFGTIEIFLAYFPRKGNRGDNPLKSFSNSDVQFKYNSSYVQAPDIVQLNTDNNQILGNQ